MTFLRKNLIDIAIFILIQYFFITLVLMYLYNGGNVINPLTPHFVWNLNYMSDLGRLYYFNGAHNPFWFFYTLTLSLIGIGTFLYFYLVSFLIRSNVIRKIIIISGLISGLGYMLVSFFPVDMFLTQHIRSGMSAFYMFIFANCLLAFFIDREQYPKIFYLTCFLNGLIIARILLLYFGNHWFDDAEFLLKLKVISQKLIIYAQIIISTYILYRIKRYRLLF